MADFNVTVTGTKTSGSSTPGDFSDANSYSSIKTAINNTTGSDNVVIDDGTYVELSTSNASNGPGGGATVTVKSRNTDASLVTWDCSSTTAANLVVNDAVTNWDLQDITLTKTLSTPINNLDLIIRQNAAASTTLTRCVISGINVSEAAITNFQGLLIDKTAGTFIITGGLTVSDITASINRLAALLHFKDTTTTIDDITFSNISITQGGAFIGTGLVLVADTTAHTFTHTGTITATAVTIECTDDNGDITGGAVGVKSDATLNDIDLTDITVTMTEGSCDGVGVFLSGTTSFGSITCDNATLVVPAGRTQGSQTGRSHGGAVFMGLDGSVITGTRVVASNGTSIIGSGLYINGDCDVTLGSLMMINNIDSGYGTFYIGGWGNVIVNNILGTGNVIDNSSTIEGPTHGGVIFAYLHESATQNRTVTINGAVIANNSVSKGDSIFDIAPLFVRHGNQPTFTMAFTMNDSALSNRTATEGIEFDPLAQGNITSIINSSFIDGALIDITNNDPVVGVRLGGSIGIRQPNGIRR